MARKLAALGHDVTIGTWDLRWRPSSISEMVKWLGGAEFVHAYRTIGERMGGSREDEIFCENLAEI